MNQLKIKVTGNLPLLMSNPQTVDTLNVYSIQKSKLTSLRKKTEADILEIRKLELESKLYWDDAIGVYIPSSWISAAIAANSFKIAKISKANVRAVCFLDEPKIKLNYDGMRGVKAIDDIVQNDRFAHLMLLKQGAVKLAKAAPIFHGWSFETTLTYDPDMINLNELKNIVDYAIKYGGLGDFRPTFGRGTVEFFEVDDEKMSA